MIVSLVSVKSCSYSKANCRMEKVNTLSFLKNCKLNKGNRVIQNMLVMLIILFLTFKIVSTTLLVKRNILRCFELLFQVMPTCTPMSQIFKKKFWICRVINERKKKCIKLKMFISLISIIL